MTDRLTSSQDAFDEAAWAQVENAIQRLEAAWKNGEDADLNRFVPPRGDPNRLLVLTRLIKADQELRWLRGVRTMLEDYLHQWDELQGAPGAVAELLEAECVTRAESGDMPTSEELRSRFPDAFAQLDFDRIRERMENACRASRPVNGVSAVPDTPSSTLEHTPATPTHLQKLAPGQRFGRYEILAKLGSGGMGVVYRAHDLHLDIDVALKIPNVDPATDPEMVERFLREARAVAKLEGVANICRVYDVDDVQGTYYIAMRLVEGRSLGERFDRIGHGPPMAPCEAAQLVRKLAVALAAVHVRGIIHRDIKPHNIMLEEGEPLLMDFGLARALNANTQSTSAGNVLGTLPYMSPEQIDGKPLDARTDTYSLGVVLYQLLTGRLPFPITDPPTRLMIRILREEPPQVRSLRAELEREIEAICLRAMAKDPNDRYQSAAEMAEALGCYLEGRRRPPPPWRRRLVGLGAAALSGVVIAALAAAYQIVIHLKPGDKVTIETPPATDGSDKGQVQGTDQSAAQTNADGKPGPASIGVQESNGFRLVVDEDLIVTGPGAETLRSVFRDVTEYTLRRSGDAIFVGCLLRDRKVTTNGKEMLHLHADRSSYTLDTSDGSHRFTAAEQNPESRNLFHKAFDAPVMEMIADSNGRVLAWDVLVGEPQRGMLFSEAQLDLIRLLQCEFFDDQKDWSFPVEIGMPGGFGALAGEVKVARLPDLASARNIAKVRVQGVLRLASGRHDRYDISVKDVCYDLAGEESFHLERREWFAGTLSIATSWRSDQNGVHKNHRGTIRLTMEQLPIDVEPKTQSVGEPLSEGRKP